MVNLSKPTVAALAAWFATGGLGLSGPDSVDFGTVVGSGGPHPERTISVQNATAQPLHIEVVTFGSSSAAFSVEGDGCSHQTLPPGGACSLIVAFRPPFANGTSQQRDHLVFWSGGHSQSIELTGVEQGGSATGNPGAGATGVLFAILVLAYTLVGLLVLAGVLTLVVLLVSSRQQKRGPGGGPL